MERSEKRAYVRVNHFGAEAEVKIGGRWYPVGVENISGGGACIIYDGDLPKRLHIRMKLKDGVFPAFKVECVADLRSEFESAGLRHHRLQFHRIHDSTRIRIDECIQRNLRAYRDSIPW